LKIGGINKSHTTTEQCVEYGRCPSCIGLDLTLSAMGQDTYGSVCRECDGFLWVTSVSIVNKDFSESFKNSKKSIFQDNYETTWSSDDLLFLEERKGLTEQLSPQSADFNNASIERENLFKKVSRFILGLLTIILLLFILFRGLSSLRKKVPLLPDTVMKKSDKKMRKSGSIYDYDPAIKYEKYAGLSMQMIRDNKGLQRFIRKNIKKGNVKNNQRLMSEKGIFHVCQSFGLYAKDCRDKWFREKKSRQAFVKKLEDLYKENGEKLLE
jgi:hypothetical protein